MDSGIYFDNIVVANDPAVAAESRDTTWAPKKAVEVSPASNPIRWVVTLTPFLADIWPTKKAVEMRRRVRMKDSEGKVLEQPPGDC